MGIYYTDSSFNELQYNPFNNNEPYDCSWVMFKLIDTAPFLQFTGGGRDGIFQLIITKENTDWEYRILDFIQYEIACGNNIILAVNQSDFDAAQKTYKGHQYIDPFLRTYEEKVLIHSTTKDSYAVILADGCLKSWGVLKENKVINEKQPIGSQLGDPPDYRDYIMFSSGVGSYSSEIVVSSKQKGYIEMDVHKPYIAGARFYFDSAEIAQDGLLIRDGAHLKVKQYLPLEKYLLWVATPEQLGISEQTTPKVFTEKADMMFEERFHMRM